MSKYLLLMALLLTGCGILFDANKYAADGEPYNEASLKDSDIILYRSADGNKRYPNAFFIEMNGAYLPCGLNNNGYIAIKHKGNVTFTATEYGSNGITKITLEPKGKHYIRVSPNKSSVMGNITGGLVGDYTSGPYVFTEVNPNKEKAFLALLREDCKVTK